MSKQQCFMHQDEDTSFCTQHAVYCCGICHSSANPGCTVMMTKDARSHYKQLIESFTSSIDDVIQQCSSSRCSLVDMYDDWRHQNDSDMDDVVTFSDKLHAVVNKFQEDCIQKIQDQSRKTNERVRELEQIKLFLNNLRDNSPNIHGHAESDSSSALSGVEAQISENLVELNTKATRMKDAVSSAKGILIKDCDLEASLTRFSIDSQSSSDVINRLKDELSAIYGRMLTKPEGTPAPRTSISLPPAVQEMDDKLSGAAQKSHSFTDKLSGDAHESHSFTDILSGAAYARECQSFTDKLSGAAQESHSFTEISSFQYTGFNPSVFYIPSSPGHVLLSVESPHRLLKIDENARELISVTTDEFIRGLCIRNNQLFATGDGGNVCIYELDKLSLLRKFPSHGIVSSIAGIGENFVVAYPDDVRVSIITNSGQLMDSTCRINNPGSVHVTPNEDRILVSDFPDNSVFILSADLKVIKKFHVERPRNMCSVGQSVFILSSGSKYVMEFSLDGSFVRTVLSRKDGIEYPYRMSYHDHSGRLAVSCTRNNKNMMVFSSKP